MKPKFFVKIFLIFFYLSSSCAFYNPFSTNKIENIWDVLRQEFALNHEVNRSEVQEQIKWLMNHPGYLQKISRQSEPYIYHIVLQIKKRKIPGELALLPMIESAFDPFAYSRAGAAGLWQLMPETAHELGLKQDWWLDARRSIRSSTDAALTYLIYLNKIFSKDWILAIAAYDSGEGTITRAIKAKNGFKKNIYFWNLSVPKETKAYVPRLLALSEIIQYPQKYHVVLPQIPYQPYFQEVNIGSQIDLNHAAKLAGISYKKLIQLNPGFNHWATTPYKPFKLLIPKENAAHFTSNLARFPEEKRTIWIKYLVKKGDNLNIVANKYHTTINLIKQLNQLPTNNLINGQILLIPSNKEHSLNIKNTYSIHLSPITNQKLIHIVQEQDTLSNIQKRYGVSAQDLTQWNQFLKNNPLKKGQAITIWKKNKSTI